MIIVCRYAILINTNYDGVDDDDIDDDENDENDNNIDNNNDNSSSCHHIDNRGNCPKIIMFISSTICKYWVSSSIC